MTAHANWLNIDPIEDEPDTGIVLQPQLPILTKQAAPLPAGGTIWFGSKPAPTFGLNSAPLEK